MTPPRLAVVDDLDCRLTRFDWRFDRDRRDEIDRHFETCRESKPALYDGRVLLASRAELVVRRHARVLEVDAFETGFSRFLAWRDFGFADQSVVNFFSMPAVRSRDGAFLLGEMGRGHSSAGAVYFPGGTPDLSDVRDDGRVELSDSLIRELAEETGLDAHDGACAPGWTVVFDRQYVACIKRIDWPEPAAALLERARAFIAAETDPELSDIHMISRLDQLADPRLPAFTRAYLDWALNSGAGGG
jgi:8-oxo-dGTP pyrophosphatase MutT (NUDIX family)